MSVPDQIPFTAATGNGVTTVFPFQFLVLKASDLVVSLAGTDLANGAGYSISGLGNTAGGSVAFVSAPGAGVAVLCRREIAMQRTTDYQFQGDLASKTVNSDFDRIWLALQGFLSRLNGSIRAPYPEQPAALPSAAQRANKVLTFDPSGNPVASAPATGSALDFAITLLTSIGTSLIGYVQFGAGALRRTLQSRLRDVYSLKDFGAVGDGVTNDTVAVQAFFKACEVNSKSGFIPRGRYLVDPISMGDPATVGIFSASGQSTGFTSIWGEDRVNTVFVASAACAGKAVLTRQNLAGMTIRGISVDGMHIADEGINLEWVYKNNIAPSSQNIIEDIGTYNCNIIGCNFNGMHDTKISGIRTAGSPIGVSLIGGGGQLSINDSAISGSLKVGAQNMEISQCVLLSGLEISSNTDNRILITGTQIFFLAVQTQTPSYCWGYAIAAVDSGTFGASVVLDTCFLFGGSTGNITGRFKGFKAKNTVFDWSNGNFFGPITAGSASPVFGFEDVCEFRGSFGSGPLGMPPAVGTVYVEAGFVSGIYYAYINTAEEFAFTPQIVSAGNLTGAGNAYSRQIGRARINGNVVNHFAHVILSAVGSHSGIIFLSGLVGTPNEQAVGSAAIAGIDSIPLPANCSSFGLQMQPLSDKAALFGYGGLPGTLTTPGTAGNRTATNAATLIAGSAIEAVIITRRS